MALEDRKVAYEAECIFRSYEDQAAMLTAEKKANPNFKVVFSQVLQDVLRMLDKAYKAFYRRVKAGADPGYPRFRGKGRYRSFTYPQGVFKLGGSKAIPLQDWIYQSLQAQGNRRLGQDLYH